MGAAETGRNPGGTLNLAIKSGTNQFHGTAYYYNRNEFFAAQSPFAPPSLHKNALRNQHYGFSLGGPIRKDKTFFFFNLEEQKYLIGNQSRSTEPSQAYQAEAEALLQQYNVPVNPVSASLLNGLWPASALTGPAAPANYFNPNPSNGYSHNGLLKLDHSFNEDNRVSFRVFLGQGTQTAPNSTHLSPYWEVVPSHMQNYDAIYNRVISSRFTNQLVAGVNYFLQTFVDADTNFNPIALGLNTGVTSPILAGAPNIVIFGFDQVGVNPFSGRTDVTGHLTDTLSYVTGKHQLRFGGEFRRTQVDVYYNFGARGVFDFTGGQGPWASLANNPNQDTNVLSLADFMAGYVYQSTNTIGNSERLVHVNSFNLFGQDAYQVTRKLNLNFGLRYEYEGPLHDNNENLSVFIPSRGLVVAGQGIPAIYPQDFLNFSPRIGFAYQPRDSGNLVVRGSYGIFFDTPPIIPFLDNVFLLNNGPLGAPDNPAGNNPVYSVQANNYTIVQNQPIFPTGPVPISGSNVLNLFSVSQTLRTPYYEMYSLNVQQSLGHHWIVQVGYVGSEGRRLLILGDINQAALGSGFNSTSVIGPNGGTFSYQQSTRPFFSKYPNFGVINEVQSEGTSNYSSLQTTLRSSQWHGLTAQFSYAWGHNLDDMTQACCSLPQDSTNLKGDYGNSDYDVRHHFTANAVYNIPGSTQGPQWITHGWQLNTVMSFRTGLPFTVHATTDTSGTGENTDRGDQIGNAYAGVSHSLVSHSYVQWVNPGRLVHLRGPSFFPRLRKWQRRIVLSNFSQTDMWLSLGLAFVGGYGDAAGFVLAKTFTGHVTGNLVLGAIAVAAHDWRAMLGHLSAIVTFLIGIVLSVLIVRPLKAWSSWPLLPTILGMEVILIVAASLALASGVAHGVEIFVISVSLALGLQNGAFRRVEGISVHTTYLTGMITSLISTEAEQYDSQVVPPPVSRTSRQRSSTRRNWALISDWQRCTAAPPCIAKAMTNCRSLTKLLPTIQQWKDRG